MSVQTDIEIKLAAGLTATHVDVVNESHKHNVPPGSESHFKVTVVSDDFSGMGAVRRHQHIYQLLSDEMLQIHALALHTYTVAEWLARQEVVPPSPPCLGGEKKRS